jgi:sigma-B regulation protein RsbU (phosphoserine phosphatase)
MASRRTSLSRFEDPPSKRKPLAVLIVDDDDLTAEFLALELEGRGCTTTQVGTGQAAIAELGANQFDLLITDWQMPGMDGMEVVRRARLQRNPDSHLHIAMMTARNEAQAIRYALEAGVDDFIMKPVDPVQLELAVASARRNHHLHRRLQRRAVLLANAHRRTREALARVEADLAAAAALHARLLPPTGEVGGLSVDLLHRPAASLGGDTIGVYPVNGGGVLFFLIDVCGHGVPTALDSFHLHHRLAALRPTDPASLTRATATLNREIAARDDDSYATMIAGIAFPDHGEGWLVRAGHPPPLLSVNQSCQPMETGGGLPLGWVADATYTPVRFPMHRGVRLAIYSDGLTECADAAGDPFGFGRLADAVASPGRSLTTVIGRIERELVAHGPRSFEDDVSLLLLEYADEEDHQ